MSFPRAIPLACGQRLHPSHDDFGLPPLESVGSNAISPVSPIDTSDPPLQIHTTTAEQSATQNCSATSQIVVLNGDRNSPEESTHKEGNGISPEACITEKPLQRRDHYIQAAIDHWLFEALALWLSSVSLAAIVIILVVHVNRPLPRWPLSITINALISVFAVIMKSALLVPVASAIGQSKWYWFGGRPHPLADIQVYDDASRGPWGSLLMLFSIRWR
jgi:hypothetical protein